MGKLAAACIVIVDVAVGVFLRATAVPFGPILFGWLVAMSGALIVSILCVLVTNRALAISLVYPVTVAATVVIVTAAESGHGEWWGPPVHFAILFSILGVGSLVGVAFVRIVRRLLWTDE